MNRYKQFEAAVFELARDFPEAWIESRSLNGTCDEGDHLILERQVGRDIRVMRIPISSENPFCGFYWGHHPPPGEMRLDRHGEGHMYGNEDYKLYFIRAFLLELRSLREISLPPPLNDFKDCTREEIREKISYWDEITVKREARKLEMLRSGKYHCQIPHEMWSRSEDALTVYIDLNGQWEWQPNDYELLRDPWGWLPGHPEYNPRSQK